MLPQVLAPVRLGITKADSRCSAGGVELRARRCTHFARLFRLKRVFPTLQKLLKQQQQETCCDIPINPLFFRIKVVCQPALPVYTIYWPLLLGQGGAPGTARNAERLAVTPRLNRNADVLHKTGFSIMSSRCCPHPPAPRSANLSHGRKIRKRRFVLPLLTLYFTLC